MLTPNVSPQAANDRRQAILDAWQRSRRQADFPNLKTFRVVLPRQQIDFSVSGDPVQAHIECVDFTWEPVRKGKYLGYVVLCEGIEVEYHWLHPPYYSELLAALFQ